MPHDGSWCTVGQFLRERTRQAPGVQQRLGAGEVLFGDGTVVTADTPYRPGEWVYLYRDLPDEAEIPGELTVLHRDSDIVVVDKPPFLATMPRGGHVAQTVVVRLRRELGLADLAPAHRLDRLTAGVLLLTVRPEVRGVYQQLFARREVAKTYLALAPIRPDLVLPTVIRSRLVKHRGVLQAQDVQGEPNSETRVELMETVGPGRISAGPGLVGRYRLTPQTGRTHQLRVHMAGLGIPILGDPLYPQVRENVGDDFCHPLQLLAHRLEFTDPITGRPRSFTSVRELTGAHSDDNDGIRSPQG
jgi:tRNA pseudouridine32 synthase/23S rRNA pseudouridine746 synthase